MKQKIYLAGGFHSEWRELVKKDETFIWFDPKKKEAKWKGVSTISMMTMEYTHWDLHFIDKADIVFVYVERNNPSCIGLSAELGYARGKNKTIILVLENNHESIDNMYFRFLRECSSVVYDNLDDGIKYLYSFVI